MPTLVRRGRLRLVIFPNDHRPAHVHVIGPDGQARIAIAEPRPVLLDNDGFSRPDLRIALALVDEHLEAVRAAWRTIHGDL